MNIRKFAIFALVAVSILSLSAASVLAQPPGKEESTTPTPTSGDSSAGAATTPAPESLRPSSTTPTETAISGFPSAAGTRLDLAAMVLDSTVVPEGLLASLGVKENASLRVRDLSQGGVSIVTEKPIKAGREVKIRLEFRITRSIIEGEGVVRWCRRDTLSLTPRWVVGIVFKRMPAKSDAELRRLERYFLGGR